MLTMSFYHQGNALTEDQRSYLEAGADHVLTKPVMIKYVNFGLLFYTDYELTETFFLLGTSKRS